MKHVILPLFFEARKETATTAAKFDPYDTNAAAVQLSSAVCLIL